MGGLISVEKSRLRSRRRLRIFFFYRKTNSRHTSDALFSIIIRPFLLHLTINGEAHTLTKEFRRFSVPYITLSKQFNDTYLSYVDILFSITGAEIFPCPCLLRLQWISSPSPLVERSDDEAQRLSYLVAHGAIFLYFPTQSTYFTWLLVDAITICFPYCFRMEREDGRERWICAAARSHYSQQAKPGVLSPSFLQINITLRK